MPRGSASASPFPGAEDGEIEDTKGRQLPAFFRWVECRHSVAAAVGGIPSGKSAWRRLLRSGKQWQLGNSYRFRQIRVAAHLSSGNPPDRLVRCRLPRQRMPGAYPEKNVRQNCAGKRRISCPNATGCHGDRGDAVQIFRRRCSRYPGRIRILREYAGRPRPPGRFRPTP